MFIASQAAQLMPAGAVIGAFHGLIIEVVLMMMSGFLVNRQRAVLLGGIVGIIVVLIYRWVAIHYASNNPIPFGPPYADMVIRLENPVVAVVYGVSLGVLLGIVYRSNKRAT